MSLRSALGGMCLALALVAAPPAGASEGKAKKGQKKKEDPPAVEEIPDYTAPDKPFRWDVPKVLTEVEVPAVMETNGIPNRMHVVVIDLPLLEAYNHFYRHFTNSGLWVAPIQEQMQLGDGQAMLTGFHPNEETSYSVLLAPQSDTRTTVILGEAYWKDRTFAPAVAFAPVYADAESLLTQNLEVGRSLQYTVRATLAEVETFYEGVLKQEGWKKEAGLWVRGPESMQLAISAATRAGYVDVALVQVNTPLPEDEPVTGTAPTAGRTGP